MYRKFGADLKFLKNIERGKTLMKKQLLIPVAVLAVGMVAAPTLVSARRGADDTIQDIRQEDRRQDNRNSTQVPAIAAGDSATTVEDNPASVSSSGVDLRGDGTPEDNSPTNSPSNSSSTSSNSPSPVSPAVASDSVTRDQAVAIANTEMPGKTLKKVESEQEHGVLVWSVRFTDGSRVDVSQVDGRVLRVRTR